MGGSSANPICWGGLSATPIGCEGGSLPPAVHRGSGAPPPATPVLGVAFEPPLVVVGRPPQMKTGVALATSEPPTFHGVGSVPPPANPEGNHRGRRGWW
jgi:hypothetical protein